MILILRSEEFPLIWNRELFDSFIREGREDPFFRPEMIAAQEIRKVVVSQC